MQYRVATLQDLPELRRLAAPLHAEFDAETAEQMLVQPVTAGHTLIFEEDGKPVAYGTVALMSDDAARLYTEQGVLNFAVTGPNVWVIEFSGDDNKVSTAHRLFTQMLREAGKTEYRYFREKDQRVHRVGV